MTFSYFVVHLFYRINNNREGGFMKNYIKVYIKVTSDFDMTGYMQPRSFIRKEGRVFDIETVKDF